VVTATHASEQVGSGEKAKATRPAGAAGKTVPSRARRQFVLPGHRSKGRPSSRALREGGAPNDDGLEGNWAEESHGHR